MEILRTPDQRLAELPGFAWPPSYVEVRADGIDVRLAYVYFKTSRSSATTGAG